MKTAATFLLALLLQAPLHAQETLIVGDIAFGGYGGPMVKLTSMNHQLGVLVGGGGGVIINHRFAVGGAGFGLVNNVTEESAPAARPYIDLGYGGVLLQYIHRSDDLIHMTASLLIGGGGASFREDITSAGGEGQPEGHPSIDGFFVAEPGVDAEVNITPYFRVAAGGSYRFVSGVEMPGLGNSDISGPGARLQLKFGAF